MNKCNVRLEHDWDELGTTPVRRCKVCLIPHPSYLGEYERLQLENQKLIDDGVKTIREANARAAAAQKRVAELQEINLKWFQEAERRSNREMEQHEARRRAEQECDKLRKVIERLTRAANHANERALMAEAFK